jgi:chorismate--pyruvate lyase
VSPLRNLSVLLMNPEPVGRRTRAPASAMGGNSNAAAPLGETLWPHRWRPLRAMWRAAIPRPWRGWVSDEASLTDRVRALCGAELRVRLVSQAWQRPLRDEAATLGLALQERALVRQVYLVCGEQAWVFARTVVPGHTLRGKHRRLARLGTRPLGAVLFTDRSVHRHSVEVACLQPWHRLYRDATRCLSPRPALLWGRRSLFMASGHPLMVTELFLPEIETVTPR